MAVIKIEEKTNMYNLGKKDDMKCSPSEEYKENIMYPYLSLNNISDSLFNKLKAGETKEFIIKLKCTNLRETQDEDTTEKSDSFDVIEISDPKQ